VFHRRAHRAQIRLLRSRPYHPQTNGEAERFIHTLLREWAYAVPYAHSRRRTRALRPWLREYKTRRPHTARSAISHRAPAFRGPHSEEPRWKAQLAPLTNHAIRPESCRLRDDLQFLRPTTLLTAREWRIFRTVT
jgi:transposase InsO family protein